MKNLLARFLCCCERDRGLSPTTLEGYDEAVKSWLKWFREDTSREAGLRDWTGDNARAYVAHERRRGIAQATVRSRVAALRSFGNWLVDEKLAADNPWTAIKTPVNEEQRQPCPSAEQVRALIEACDRIPNVARGRMTKAAVSLMALAGLRMCELIRLRVSDVFLAGSRRYVHIQQGKGNKTGSVPLSAAGCAILEDWLAVRPTTDLPNLLLLRGETLGDRPYTACAFTDALTLLKALSGLRDEDITAHALRRFAGTSIAQQPGASIADAQKLLRQSSIQTTMRYLKPTNRLDSLVEGILPPASAPQPQQPDNRVKAPQSKRKPGWRRA